MPEKVATFIEYMAEIKAALFFWMIGATIGVGQHLGSNDVFSWRIVIGRALSTGGLSVVAGAALMAFPDIPPLAHIGVAAGVASLGTNSLEAMLKRYLFGKA